MSKRPVWICAALALCSLAVGPDSAGAQWGYPYPVYPADSSVRIEVKPRQAEVYVDGYYAGIVNDFDGTFQRLHLAPGEHEIELYLDGYRTVRQKVYLTPDNTFKVRYEMEKLPAGEAPEPRPQPTAPAAGQGQPSGQPAYPSAPRGQGRRHAPPQPPDAPPSNLPPPGPEPGVAGGVRTSGYGTLSIRVQPGEADILIDGEKWRGPEGQDRLVIEVTEGRHTIEIRKEGYRTYVTDIDIQRGETMPLNVSLRQGDK